MGPEGLNWRHLRQPLHGLRLVVRPSAGTVANLPAGEEGERPLPIWENPASPAVRELLWRKEEQGERYASLLQLFRTDAGLLLKIDCEGSGSFEYRPEGIGIHWKREGTGPEHYFQTLGAALWLERKGIPCIHANALDTGREAIGLLAPSRTGKSTLTAALLEAGMQMMTDDMLALHPTREGWRVFPGWPRLRFWPDMAANLLGRDPAPMERVHERFEKRILDLQENRRWAHCESPRPLKALYLLDRQAEPSGEVRITSLSPGEAMLHLLQNSMLADAYRPLGLERARLEVLAGVVGRIPLWRIRYPSGLERLPEVARAIVGNN